MSLWLSPDAELQWALVHSTLLPLGMEHATNVFPLLENLSEA